MLFNYFIFIFVSRLLATYMMFVTIQQQAAPLQQISATVAAIVAANARIHHVRTLHTVTTCRL